MAGFFFIYAYAIYTGFLIIPMLSDAKMQPVDVKNVVSIRI